MLLTNTPASERTHIAFFGKRNAGKSSLINAVTNQELSIVSDTPGTTTDPVRKTMELLPLGPVVIIDTPGIDDEGELGEKRVERTLKTLDTADIAILVSESKDGFDSFELELIDSFKSKEIPFLVAITKCDLSEPKEPVIDAPIIFTSVVNNSGIEALKESMARLVKSSERQKYIISDLLSYGDVVVLVIPIDSSAPKGRLILPQQLVIRDLLDNGMIPICCKDSELAITIEKLNSPPALVITDSQAFDKVSKIVPKEINLTSFSILMARYKGTLKTSVDGAMALDRINDEDTILISEGCTHHRQCEDIGTVKLPKWIREYTKSSPVFTFTSGRDFPDDLEKYSLIIHCGACMLNEKEINSRYEKAINKNIPITNYGMAIAKMNGILDRSLKFSFY